MARSYHEQSDVSIRLGDARKKQDPLVLNFSGTATQLTGQRFKFDLNSDGKSEDINMVTGGSGFLALDRNGDGKINNGSEAIRNQKRKLLCRIGGLTLITTADRRKRRRLRAVAGLDPDVSGNDQVFTLKQAMFGGPQPRPSRNAI